MEWIDKLDVAVTVTDENGHIIYMNDKAARTFEKQGGRELIGSSLSECHNERSNRIIADIIRTRTNNVYTIEKNGKKKLIFQAPWPADGAFRGLVELSLELPAELPHFIRD